MNEADGGIRNARVIDLNFLENRYMYTGVIYFRFFNTLKIPVYSGISLFISTYYIT